jgi:FlaA1/EpsC-like NDP-sugar epimerase
MLTCMLGKSGEIFFPKFTPDMLTGFYDIAHKFLEASGYELLVCTTEEEAKEAAKALRMGSREYPVYSFESDTTGEKLYEEFYTEEEDPDLEHFKSLGVIRSVKNKVNPQEMEIFFEQMEKLMTKPEVQKMEIVTLLEKYIPSFSHKETGKLLDKKM